MKTPNGTSAAQAPANAPQEARRDAWGRYWRSGALHSCAGSFSGNYGGAIAEFWQSRFAAIPHSARVLDVATGNGALPCLLVRCLPDAAIECDAVDVAAIAPAWCQHLPTEQRMRLRFHADTRAERLPFAEDLFDLVVSQYGLEYTDVPRSCVELRRVAKPHAELALVAHHSLSHPVKLGREERQHIGWMLETGGLLGTARELLEPFERAQSYAGRQSLARDQKAITARDRFNALQLELTDRANASACPDVLHEVRQALAGVLERAAKQGALAAEASLDTLRADLQDSALRLADLLRCALDADGVAALLGCLGDPVCTSVTPLKESAHLMGWAIVARLEKAIPIR